MTDRWVRRKGDLVVLDAAHKDDGLYELLRRIEYLENELAIERLKSKNLERMYDEVCERVQ